MKVLMLHGINHNMFGKRDPLQYGTITLAEIDARLGELAASLDVEIESFQSNYEGAMCERIHQAYLEGSDAVLINAGAWTHYSYGIRDALAILSVPVVEIHMSQHPCPRSLPPPLGIRRRGARADQRLWRGQLPAGLAHRGNGGARRTGVSCASARL